MKSIFMVLLALMYLPLPAQNNSTHIPEKQKPISTNQTISSSKTILNTNSVQPFTTDSYASISFKLMTDVRSLYDAQTAGSPHQIWQDPNNPNNIHAVYTYSREIIGTLWDSSKVYYFFSSNKGLTWARTLIDTGRIQRAYITGLSDGRPLICLNAGRMEPAINYTRIYVGGPVGSGTFTTLLPGGDNYLSPKIIATSSTSLTNKFVFINSEFPSTTHVNIGTSLTSSSFTGYGTYPGNQTSQSNIGRGADGRIGIVYSLGDINQPNGQGNVYFMESTDNGTTFSTPVLIYENNSANENQGAYSGLSVIYQGNTPKVFFTTVYAPTNFTNYTKAQVRFWSPTLPGTDPARTKTIADTTNVLNSQGGGGYPSLGKYGLPSSGISADGNFISCCFVAMDTSYAVMTTGTLTTNIHYHHIYITNSTDGGATWSTPERITPLTPSYDWMYASISPVNDQDANYYYVNMTVQRDTVPGNWYQTRQYDFAQQTAAKPYFVRAAYTITSPAPPPTLASPVNNSQGVATNVNLQWGAISNALSYNVQISTDAYFNTIVYSRTNVTGTSHPVEAGNLALNTNYWWRIQPVRSSGAGMYSDGWGFHTRTTGVEPVSSNLPSVYKLYGNYPNPFNPTTKIKFDLPKNSFVKINIFDVTGRLVNELVNLNLQPGSYETEFNGMNLSSGVYYYRIEAGEFIETNKMILVK
jgi:hypothetical protein